MQATLGVLAAVSGALLAGLFGLAAALMSGRNAQRQTRLQHQLDQDEHARQERETLYQDILAWGVTLTIDLLTVRTRRDRRQLACVLENACQQSAALIPRLLLSATPEIEHRVATLDRALGRLQILCPDPAILATSLTQDEVQQLAMLALEVGTQVHALAVAMRRDLGADGTRCHHASGPVPSWQ